MPKITRPTLRTAASGLTAGVVVADLCAIAFYVTVGRASHDESLSAGGLLSTSWPFLVGLAGGYLGAAMLSWPVASLRGGAVIVTKCLIIGLVLRYGVEREGTAFSFIVVTVLVLTALMIGWRLVATAGALRMRAPAAARDQRY